MKAVDNRVLIKSKKLENATVKIGNFEIPADANEYEIAEIVSVGPDVKGIEAGDTAYIYIGSGHQFHHEGEEYRVISTSEILVIL
jgi:co-chaperonin GroES (HSP10)